MATTESRDPSVPRRWSASEKCRIVELSLREGASVSEIALAHGIHHTSLSHWRSLYRAGKLSQNSPRARTSRTAAGAALLPVMISTGSQADAPVSQTTGDFAAGLGTYERDIVHVTLSSGATLRIETGSADATFVCALLAELRG
jgi:transposase-like protein